MATLRRSASVVLPDPTTRIARVWALERRECKLFLAFLTPGLVLSIGAIFLPVLYAIQLSFYHAESFIATPRFVGLANDVQMFTDSRYWQVLLHGLMYAVSTVCLQVLIGIGMALLLHLEFHGRNWLWGAAMAPYILPTVIVVYIWKWGLDVNHGLINITLSGLGTVEWFGTPTTVKCALFSLYVRPGVSPAARALYRPAPCSSAEGYTDSKSGHMTLAQ